MISYCNRSRVHRFRVHGKPACHARPENIWEEEVIGAVQGMVEEKTRVKARAGRPACLALQSIAGRWRAGQILAGLGASSTKER